MSAGLRRGFNETLVYFILGAALMIGSFFVGWVVVFADAVMIPLGDVGRVIIVVVTVTLNGVLVIIIAQQKKLIKSSVSKAVPG